MIQLAEWMFWILNSLRDDFHHSFHNTTHVEQRLQRLQPSLLADG
jgi:hypothetical protein